MDTLINKVVALINLVDGYFMTSHQLGCTHAGHTLGITATRRHAHVRVVDPTVQGTGDMVQYKPMHKPRHRCA